MVHAEMYVATNVALCVCALMLGGKFAGLAVPRPAALLQATALCAAFCIIPLYLPNLSALALPALALAVWLCFKERGMQACVRCTVTTLSASLFTGGAVQAMWTAGMPVPLAVLLAILLNFLVYMLVTLLPTALCEVRQVELTVAEHSVILPAMLDSGNLLRDPVTGLPVLVVPERAVLALFPSVAHLCDLRGLPLGFRLLNVRTAAGSALLPMFRPDACRLYLNGHAVDAELLVAVTGQEYGGVQALVPMAALSTNAAAL